MARSLSVLQLSGFSLMLMAASTLMAAPAGNSGNTSAANILYRLSCDAVHNKANVLSNYSAQEPYTWRWQDPVSKQVLVFGDTAGNGVQCGAVSLPSGAAANSEALIQMSGELSKAAKLLATNTPVDQIDTSYFKNAAKIYNANQPVAASANAPLASVVSQLGTTNSRTAQYIARALAEQGQEGGAGGGGGSGGGAGITAESALGVGAASSGAGGTQGSNVAPASALGLAGSSEEQGGAGGAGGGGSGGGGATAPGGGGAGGGGSGGGGGAGGGGATGGGASGGASGGSASGATTGAASGAASGAQTSGAASGASSGGDQGSTTSSAGSSSGASSGGAVVQPTESSNTCADPANANSPLCSYPTIPDCSNPANANDPACAIQNCSLPENANNPMCAGQGNFPTPEQCQSDPQYEADPRCVGTVGAAPGSATLPTSGLSRYMPVHPAYSLVEDSYLKMRQQNSQGGQSPSPADLYNGIVAATPGLTSALRCIGTADACQATAATWDPLYDAQLGGQAIEAVKNNMLGPLFTSVIEGGGTSCPTGYRYHNTNSGNGGVAHCDITNYTPGKLAWCIPAGGDFSRGGPPCPYP